MSPEFISVVMPLYNNAPVVRRAVDSVTRQTVPDFELIVVNDGSDDGGDAVVRLLTDKRIRIIDQQNKGVSATRNRGVAEARGELVAFLDADDEWKPDFLATILRLHQAFPRCGIYATHYVYRELDGNIRTPILRKVPPGEWEGVLENYFEVASSSDPPVWSSAVAVRKEALFTFGGFPEGVAIGEDLLTWARLAVSEQVAYSKKRCSVFWLRSSLTGYPTRKPEIPDVVGDLLEGLLGKVSAEQKHGYLRYVGMWHRMRASMFVHLDDRTNAIKEIKKMAAYSPGDPQTYLYGAIALTPRIIRKFVLQFFTFVRSLRRSIRR